jgi:hypothetical protein
LFLVVINHIFSGCALHQRLTRTRTRDPLFCHQPFDALLAQLRAEFEPVGVLENFTVERIALGMVRRQRGERLEAAFLDADVPKEIDPIQSIMGNAEADAPLSASTVENLCNLGGRYETATARRLTADVSMLLSLQRERRSLASFRNSGGND